MNTIPNGILPPAKKRKVESLEPAFFLDSFPQEILDNLLRLPNAKKWQTYIEVRDLLQLFAVRGGLGTFLKGVFDTLCVSGTKRCHDDPGWKARDDPHL